MSKIKIQSSEQILLNDLSKLIEQSKQFAVVQANSVLTMLFWNVGKRINDEILQNKRADYGKRIVSTLSTQLKAKYGKNFELRNLRRMMQFAEQFPNLEIVSPLTAQLSWSHFVELLPLKEEKARLFYATEVRERDFGVRELRQSIERKEFERTEIANIKLAKQSPVPFNVFKDPYFLDFLNLPKKFFENDLEDAILKELERFILEMGKGFAFVERQKRIPIDSVDYSLDLLFFHRKLNRLIAIDLKLGKFKPKYKGQMELYLKYLKLHDKQPHENLPIGLLLCSEGNTEHIELLMLDETNIKVAQYLTALPDKQWFIDKLNKSIAIAQENAKQLNSNVN